MSDKLLNEYHWNPIKLGQGYDFSAKHDDNSQMASSQWYNKYISTEGDRRTKMFRYNKMDMASVEIARALDTIAEDSSFSNVTNDSAFEATAKEGTFLLKGMVKAMGYIKDKWELRTGLDTELYYHIREVVKYGFLIFMKKKDGSIKKLRQEQAVGYVLSGEDETEVTHYLIDFDAPYADISENYKVAHTNKATRGGGKEGQSIRPVSVNELLVLKIGVGPFGESILERIYPVWAKMQLLEDAVVIYRVVRAPERRVFYIDVGRQPAHKQEQIMKRYMMKLRQKQVVKNGEVSTEFDPQSTTEDFFLPVTSTGRSSRIETLQGGQGIGELGDVTYMARKLAKGLRVPPSMVETHNDQNDRDSYSDMRVGQVYQVEMRYMGYIKRIQQRIAKPLYQHFLDFAEARGVAIPVEKVDFFLKEAHSFTLYREIELNQSLLNVFNSTTQAPGMSKKYAMKRFLNMDEDALIENEIMTLREKGLDDEQIKIIPQFAVDNVVYGDGRLGKDYGLPEVDPDQARF